MSRSSASSGSSTPSPQPSPNVLSSFDPFAVHPFTNYSGPSQHGKQPLPPNQMHILPHPSTLTLDGPAVPSYQQTQFSAAQSSNRVYHPAPAPVGYQSQACQTYSGPASSARPIFVPFRQETSSPDLSDVLRRKRTSGL